MLLRTRVYRCFSDFAFILVRYILKSELAGLYGNSVFNFLRNYRIVFQCLYHFTFPPVVPSVPVSPHPCHTVVSCLTVVECGVVSCFGFDLHFGTDDWCWAFFPVFWPFVYLIWRSICSSLWPAVEMGWGFLFCLGVLLLLLGGVLGVLYRFWILIPYQIDDF